MNCGIVAISWYFIDVEYITHEQWSNYAWMSLTLTLVNIVMIWLSSMLMFRLKEILPIEKKIFWSDLSIARKIYQVKPIFFSFNERVIILVADILISLGQGNSSSSGIRSRGEQSS